MANDVHKKEEHFTTYSKTYSEKELQGLLEKDLMARSELADVPPHKVKSRVIVDSRDSSTGPYREYKVALTVDHKS